MLAILLMIAITVLIRIQCHFEVHVRYLIL